MYINTRPRDLLSVAVVGTLFLLFISPAARSADPDIETIGQRVLQRMQDRSVNDEKVRQLMNDMTSDGYWPDGDRYRYIVAPGVEPDRTKTYLTDQSPIRVLSNTSSLQAVRHRDVQLTMMAFYEAARSSIDDEHTISVDRPCLLMVKREENGYDVTVSNPEGNAANVRVRIRSKQTEKVVSERTFELPGGQQGGRSVTHTIRTN